MRSTSRLLRLYVRVIPQTNVSPNMTRFKHLNDKQKKIVKRAIKEEILDLPPGRRGPLSAKDEALLQKHLDEYANVRANPLHYSCLISALLRASNNNHAHAEEVPTRRSSRSSASSRA